MKVLVNSLSLLLICCCSFAAQEPLSSIMINGVKREFGLHLPSNYKSNGNCPLVLIFHGGGGNARQMQSYMGMDRIADIEGFITVYPQGINKQWNDGREFDEKIASNDDLLFISSLLDTLELRYAIDKSRIFCTGISNGGFFSIYLSLRMSERLLAAAPVCASIPEKILNKFQPLHPVSMLFINGTKDPLVPFEGGTVGNSLTGSRGNCSSTDTTLQRFIRYDHTLLKAQIKRFPDRDKWDGCTAVQYSFIDGDSQTTVALVKVINGGHTLPGASRYLPKFIVGKVCRDFEANELIWEFFSKCRSKS